MFSLGARGGVVESTEDDDSLGEMFVLDEYLLCEGYSSGTTRP
jgi:hypothetical protein